MTETATPAPKPARDLRAALALVAALTLARLVALFTTPLELYPDEAQYWLWSRTLDFGYYSKPPMIAWTIWATTAVGGDAEAWVRVSACLFQAGATLVVFLIGRRLYSPTVGFAARHSPRARSAALAFSWQSSSACCAASRWISAVSTETSASR